MKRVNMDLLVRGHLPDREPNTAEEQAIYGHIIGIIRVRQVFAPGRRATGVAIVMPIAEADDLPVLDRVNKGWKVACMGQIVKHDSSTDFGRFPDGIVQNQCIDHRFPDASVLLVFVDIVSVSIPPFTRDLDVELIEDRVDMVVKRSFWEVFPVFVQGRPEPFPVNLLEGDSIRAADGVEEPDVTAQQLFCQGAYLLS